MLPHGGYSHALDLSHVCFAAYVAVDIMCYVHPVAGPAEISVAAHGCRMLSELALRLLNQIVLCPWEMKLVCVLVDLWFSYLCY